MIIKIIGCTNYKNYYKKQIYLKKVATVPFLTGIIKRKSSLDKPNSISSGMLMLKKE